jgi:hypothetical protein
MFIARSEYGKLHHVSLHGGIANSFGQTVESSMHPDPDVLRPYGNTFTYDGPPIAPSPRKVVCSRSNTLLKLSN